MHFSIQLPAPVGSDAYFIHDNAVAKSEVICIKIFISKHKELPPAVYVVKNPNARSNENLERYSHQVFATKQELLESL